MSRPSFLNGALCAFGLCCATLASAQCSLQRLAPQNDRISLGRLTITLGQADHPEQPTAWQGPLRAGRCTFAIGIIEQPLALTPSGDLYVATYSGSEREIALYDLKKCTTRWKSAVFAGKLELTSSVLQMGEKAVKLDGQCVPRERATIAKP
jgi:hypothetical protein